MKNEYRIVGYEVLKAGSLKPHPDVQLPMDEEDKVALGESVGEQGILQPLIVSKEKDKADGRRFIYEGVNRWKTRIESADVPCLLVECDNPRELALTFLGVGRKRSTGQRIMAFLEVHRKEVLKVAAMVSGEGRTAHQQRDRAGHVTGTVITGVLANFTAEAIAEKLHVSAKDVGLGIELLQCIEQKRTASWDRGSLHLEGEALDMEADKGKEYHKALKKVHLGLLAGSTPIRRWKPAVGGLAKTEGKPRPKIDHGKLGYNAILTIKNTIKNWDLVSSGDKQNIARVWEELRTAAAKVHLD